MGDAKMSTQKFEELRQLSELYSEELAQFWRDSDPDFGTEDQS